MEFLQPFALPPDQEGCQEISADFIERGSNMILDGQKINDGNGIGNPKQQEQCQDKPCNLLVIFFLNTDRRDWNSQIVKSLRYPFGSNGQYSQAKRYPRPEVHREWETKVSPAKAGLRPKPAEHNLPAHPLAGRRVS